MKNFFLLVLKAVMSFLLLVMPTTFDTYEFVAVAGYSAFGYFTSDLSESGPSEPHPSEYGPSFRIMVLLNLILSEPMVLLNLVIFFTLGSGTSTLVFLHLVFLHLVILHPGSSESGPFSSGHKFRYSLRGQ